MKRREWLTATFNEIEDMLTARDRDMEHWFHWPIAKAASITLEINRDKSSRPEPFTEWDVMPHLPGGPEIDPDEEEKIGRMRAIGLFEKYRNMPGFEIVLDSDT